MAKAKKSKEETKAVKKAKAFKVVFTASKLFTNSKDAFTLYQQSRFGEPIEGKIYYALVEALYLLEKGKIEVLYKKKRLSPSAFLELAEEHEKNFFTKYIVFKNLRDRGYILKTALKFGADFRVYEKGVKPGEEHAKWILYPVSESTGLTWHEFAAKNRVAHSTKKNLLIAVVDEEGDVSYWESQWIRP